MQDLDPKAIKELGHKEHFSLLKCRNRIITISPLMKEILRMTRKPHSIEEVAQRISKQKNCMYDQVFPSIQSFLGKMIRIGVVEQEGRVQTQEINIYAKTRLKPLLNMFNLLERIDENSKTAIYTCTRKGNRKKKYVLKVFSQGKSKSDYRREFDILDTLPPYPHIRRGIEATVSNGVPYILLDYVEGKPMLEVGENLHLEKKYQVISQLMLTIAHLHKNKVLHGDIHASNFLIDSKNDLYLIDLGMAYYENEKKVRHGGIPRYMPPERIPEHHMIFSERKGDYVSEVFQVAICIYLLLAGKPPFEGTLLKELAFAIRHNPPSPLEKTKLGEAIPESVARIVLKALEKDPSNRYQSLSEMHECWNRTVDDL